MKMKGLGALALVLVMTCITSAAVAQPLPDEDDLPDVPVVNCEEPGAYQEPDSSPTPADPLTTPACRAKGEKWDGPTPRPAPFEPEGEHPSPGSAEEGGSSSPEGGDPEETDTPEPSRPWTPYNGAMSGIQLSQGFTGQVGIYAALQVRDSGVPRNSSQYLSQRVLAKSCDNNNWLEIGWAEAGWRDDRQYIYTHDTPSSSWVFYDQYPLTPGQRVYVMVTQAGSNSNLWQTWLHWNGGWHLLRETVNTAWLGCGGEVMVDRYQTGNGTYFNINGTIETGDGSSTGVQVKETGSGLWRSWDSSVPTATYPGEPGWCSTLVVQFTSPYTKWNTNSVNCAPQTALSLTPASGTTNTIFRAKLSGTIDPNGDEMSSFRIEWGDGTHSYPQGVNDEWTHQYASPGSYQVRGYACDLFTCRYSAPQSAHVDTANQAPAITFNVSPTSGDRSTMFNANFNGTYDPNNDPISYRIDWGDGWINNSQNANHRYQNAGTYTVTGRACDGFGACSTSSRTVAVAFSNEPPTANLSVSPQTGDTRTTFTATLTGSDPEGDPITYEIDWGDGATTSGSSGTHTYESPGRYVVAGIVTDSHGATDSDTREVVVCAIYEQGQCVERPPRQDPPSPNLPGEVTRPVAEIIRSAPEPKDLAPSESNEVMILAANIRQSYAVNNDDPCRRNSEADCDSPGRLKRFVQRILTLVAKSGGDGMGNVAPDVLLLQEARLGQAESIASKLHRRLGPNYVAYAGAEDPEIPDTQEVDDWCLRRHLTTFQECTELIKIKADSAIIYNDDVLNPIGTTYYDSKYDPDERCDLIAGQDIDEDDDGDLDCQWAKWKRQYLAGFDEHRVNRPGRLTGYSFAVASTHFVTASHFKDDDQKQESNVRHEEKKTLWTGEIADELSADFPLLDSYLMGGDFNVHRCRNKPRLLPGDYPSTANACETRGWWTGLTGRGFLDAILERHIQDDTSRDRIREQYRDGKSGNTQTYRDKRIDYIFSSSANIRRASFDLTCGEGATGRQERNCRDFQNPEFYSDHRLLWTLVRDL